MASWTIGRTSDNDIVISDQSVSRRHAELRALGGGRYELVDVGSSNGTGLRGPGGWEPVDRSPVTADDVVRFGDHEIAVARLLDAVGESRGDETVRADTGGRGDHGASYRGHAPRGDDGPVPGLDAGIGTLERMVPGLSPGSLRAAGIVAFGIAGLVVVFGFLSLVPVFTAPILGMVHILAGLAAIYVMLTLKKVLNRGFAFDRANLWINLIVIMAIVSAVASLLFGILAVLGVAAMTAGSPGGGGAMMAGFGLFGIVMLVINFVNGIFWILLGVALLKIKDTAGGLMAAYAYLAIIGGALLCTVILAMLGGLLMLAAWIVLGIQMLKWADQPPFHTAQVFD